MKKICLFLALCLLLGSLTGCNDQSGTTETTLSTETTEDTTPIPSETEEPVVIGYDITLDVDFTALVAEDDRTIYRSPNEGDESSILIRTQPRDESVLSLDIQGFVDMQGDGYLSGAPGSTPTGPVESEQPETQNQGRMYSFVNTEVIQVDGFPALFADYMTTLDGVSTHVMEYHVVATENYLFRFTDCTEDGAWLEGFARSAETINMLMENEGVTLDYSDLKEFDLGCGISIHAQDGLTAHEAPGFTACLGNQNAIILVMQDKKEENNLTEMDLYDYAELVSDANELGEFTQDHYGTLHSSFYSTDEMGIKYYNLLTVHETGDSFWVFQMTCSAANQATYALEFSRWATSIEPIGRG